MFALKPSKANKLERKAKRAGPGQEEKDTSQANPVWQSLALGSAAIHPKLSLSQPGDPDEREADRVADRVLRMPTPAAADVKLATSSSDAPNAHRSRREEEEEEGKVQHQPRRVVGQATASTERGPLKAVGQPLDSTSRSFFEPRFGQDFGNVRIHTDQQSADQASLLQAEAFTVGSNIAFGKDQYRPESHDGRRLLAHELAHVAHQSDPVGNSLGQGNRRDLGPTSGPAGSAIIHRQIAEIGSLILGYRAYRAHAARNEVVELQGHPTFSPSRELADWIRLMTEVSAASEAAGIFRESALVNVRFGNLGTARIPMLVNSSGRYFSDGPATMDLRIEGLGDEDRSVSPLLLFGVDDSNVLGVFGGVAHAGAATDWQTLFGTILNEGARRLMEWGGMENPTMSSAAVGELVGGHLDLTPSSFNFDLAGTFTGSGTFGIHDGTVTFDATASIHVPGLDDATLTLIRDPMGNLSATARMAVRLGGFEGRLLASFGRGVLDIRGTATYHNRGFDGSVTLLVTDEARAWEAVKGELTHWPPVGVGAAALTLGPTSGVAPSANRHVVAGWGLVDFRYKNWLHGRAQVIVDPEGDITSMGRVHVPQDIEIMDVKEFRRRSIAGFHESVEVLSAWDIFAIRIGADCNIHASAHIGPAYLRDLHAAGAFSTKQNFPNHLTIGGRLEMGAGARLEIKLKAYVAAVAQVPVVGHVTERARWEIASTRVTLSGVGEADAHAAADAAIHRTEPKGSGEADYSISGTLSARASMGFTFTGTASIDMPLFHANRELTFLNRHYTLGRVHGSVNFRNFKIGDSTPPEIAMARDEDDIPVSEFFRDIIRDGEGIPSQPDLDDETATWTPIGVGDPVGEEGDEPDAAVIPSDPHFGLPTIPPTAAPPAQQGLPPTGGPVIDQPGGTGDAADISPPSEGTPDAGADAGVATAPADADSPRDAGVPAGGVGEVEPAPEPERPDPNRNLSVVVPFDMQGTPHQLILTPGPHLLMASERGPLTTKLGLKRAEVDRLAREAAADPTLGPTYDNQRNILDELIEEADGVEQNARQLGFGAGYTGPVPGLRPLADRIHGVAQQFGWYDIITYVTTDPRLAPQPGDEFVTRFNRPAALIARAFANVAGTRTTEADVREVLRAYTSSSDTNTLSQMLDMMAAGGPLGTGVADFFGRVSRIRNVSGVEFVLSDLFAAHVRGDAVLDHGPLQTGIFLNDLVGVRAMLGEGRLDVGTAGRMPASLLNPPLLDFVILETRGSARLVLGHEHSGLSVGAAYVFAAGQIRYNRDGIVTEMNRASGHYKPSVANLQRAARFLLDRGNLSIRRPVTLITEFD